MPPTGRPLCCWKSLLRNARLQNTPKRPMSTYRQAVNSSPLPFPISKPKAPKKIPNFKPPPSLLDNCKDPIAALQASQIARLDPTGSRSYLFSKANKEAAKVGDILLVRQKNGDPFAGVCINIRRRGVDTAILLRNQLTRVGVEMWYKIYSPNVEGIEVVQRYQKKRARRARLTYMRKPKHDLGSVQGVVSAYLRQRRSLTEGMAGSSSSQNKSNKKKGKGKR